MAQLNSTNVYGSLAVTSDISEGGTLLSSKYAAFGHTHSTSIAASSSSNQLTLEASTKYAITAGGTSYVFTTPPNTTYESKAAASGGTNLSLVTTGEKYTWNNKSDLTIGTTATTAAAGNHSHTTSLTAGGTSTVNLSSSTAYTLTAGGNSVVFKTPSDTTYESKTAASGGTDLSLCTTGEKYTWNNKSNLSIGTTATTAAAGNHTHSYAGSASAGGAANSVKASLVLKVKTGTTEGTNLYTFDGSDAKTLDIKEGSNISLTAAAGSVTIANTYSYTHPSGFGAKSTSAVYKFTVNDNGHVTAGDAVTSMPASDVYAWAKAATKPTYTASEVGAAASSHTHNYAGIASGESAGGKAASAKIADSAGDGELIIYPEDGNEINFGGTSTSTEIWFGYKGEDSRPVPTTYSFGTNRNATIYAGKVYGAVFN